MGDSFVPYIWFWHGCVHSTSSSIPDKVQWEHHHLSGLVFETEIESWPIDALINVLYKVDLSIAYSVFWPMLKPWVMWALGVYTGEQVDPCNTSDLKWWLFVEEASWLMFSDNSCLVWAGEQSFKINLFPDLQWWEWNCYLAYDEQ